MRIFEVMLKKNRTETECGMKWPVWWGAVVQKVDVVAYEDHPEALGAREEDVVCVTDDETWKLIAAKKDKAVSALTEAAANEKGRAWRPQVTRVTDQQKVLLIMAKVALGQAISSEERKALDPDDATPGIEKSKLFNVAQIAADKGDVLREARV